MVDAYQDGNMVAVMEVSPEETSSYGIITPDHENGPLIKVKGLIEKPAPGKAPSNLAVVGRYIIEPGVFTNLAEGQKGAGGEIQLTDALAQQIGKSTFYGLRFSGERFDCGSKIGFLQANIAFGMANESLASDLESWIRGRFS